MTLEALLARLESADINLRTLSTAATCGWVTPDRGRAPGRASLHRDARAPVNLTPIAGLERHLHRLQGDARLALRAVREAVLERNREGPTA